MQPGDLLIYRRREDAPSERVLFLQLQDRKQKPRLEVEFTAGDAAGTREWVPQNRIYGDWAEVEAADAERDGLARLRADDDLTDVETTAIADVYDLLVPLATCEWEWNPVRWGSRVRDQAALEEDLEAPLGDVLGESATMCHHGALLLSPNGSSKVAEALCRAHSEQVVAWVLEQEERRRVWTKTGKPAGVDGERRGTSTRWEWEMYRSTSRPLYELLRSWCGHRAVTAHERRVAAEAEVRRLELLVHECLEAIRKGYAPWAESGSSESGSHPRRFARSSSGLWTPPRSRCGLSTETPVIGPSSGRLSSRLGLPSRCIAPNHHHRCHECGAE